MLLKDPDDPKVFWVKRGPTVRFMAGYHAFPGGQIDNDDCVIEVLNSNDAKESRLIACAAREVLEETGVLIARGCQRISPEKMAQLRNEVNSGAINFSEVLRREDLQLDRGHVPDGASLGHSTPMPRR